jgi:HPt (histidine-containing phosphotransfer) domain-containing protein
MENKNKNFVVYVDEDLKNLIPKFLAKQRIHVEKIKVALKDLNYSDLKTLGHQMKGSCGGYGFLDLGNLGAQIEKLAETQSTTDLSQKVNELEDCFYNLKVEYKK